MQSRVLVGIYCLLNRFKLQQRTEELATILIELAIGVHVSNGKNVDVNRWIMLQPRDDATESSQKIYTDVISSLLSKKYITAQGG